MYSCQPSHSHFRSSARSYTPARQKAYSRSHIPRKLYLHFSGSCQTISQNRRSARWRRCPSLHPSRPLRNARHFRTCHLRGSPGAGCYSTHCNHLHLIFLLLPMSCHSAAVHSHRQEHFHLHHSIRNCRHGYPRGTDRVPCRYHVPYMRRRSLPGYPFFVSPHRPDSLSPLPHHSLCIHCPRYRIHRGALLSRSTCGIRLLVQL